MSNSNSLYLLFKNNRVEMTKVLYTLNKSNTVQKGSKTKKDQENKTKQA